MAIGARGGMGRSERTLLIGSQNLVRYEEVEESVCICVFCFFSIEVVIAYVVSSIDKMYYKKGKKKRESSLFIIGMSVRSVFPSCTVLYRYL